MSQVLSFELYLKQKQDVINYFLMEWLKDSSREERLLAAMRYAVTAGGKRLRPVLCIAAAEAVGGNETHVMATACALEMIHTYSLIHDDLPAMDNDTLRRGQPTCHIAFDEATAILAGDALLTLAFEILSDHRGFQVEPERRIKVIQAIGKAAGARGMVAGQMMDIRSEGKPIDQPALEALHQAKTGALIEASIYAGSILGGGTTTQIEALRRYARSIGLAFQVADDILNVEGDPALMGKAVGSDAARQKATYPSLLGLANAKSLAENAVKQALKAIDFFDNRSDPLRALADYVIYRKR